MIRPPGIFKTPSRNTGRGGGPKRTLDEAALRAELAELLHMKRTIARRDRIKVVRSRLEAIAHRSPFK